MVYAPAVGVTNILNCDLDLITAYPSTLSLISGCLSRITSAELSLSLATDIIVQNCFVHCALQ